MDQDKNISMEVDGHNEMNPLMELPFHGADEVEFATVGATNKVMAPNSRSPLGKKRANQSENWDNFSRIIDEKTHKIVRVKCIHCRVEYVYNVDHGTSIMWKHLKKCKKLSSCR